MATKKVLRPPAGAEDTLPDWSQFIWDDETLSRWSAEDQQTALERQAQQPTGFARAAGDIGLGVLQGGTNLVEGAGTLYGLATGNMDNAVRREAIQAGSTLQGMESPTLQARRTLAQQAINAQQGVLGKAWESAKQYVTDPRLLSSELAKQVALMAPGLAAGRVVSGLAKGAKAASSLGTGTAVSTAALQQGADVASSTFSDAMKQGATPESALQAARAAFLSSTAASLGSMTLIPGGATIERAIAGRAGSVGRGFLGAGARGLLGETAQEAVEEGSGQFFSNAAQRDIGIDVPLSQGVGEAAGLAGALGGILGGPIGTITHRPVDQSTQTPAAPPPAPTLAPPPDTSKQFDLLSGTNYDIPTVARVPDTTSVNPPAPSGVPAPDVLPPATPAAPTVAPAAEPTAAQGGEQVTADRGARIAARQSAVRSGQSVLEDFTQAFDQTLELLGGEESPALTGRARAALGNIAMAVYNAKDRLKALEDAILAQETSKNKSSVLLGTVLTHWYEQLTGVPYEGSGLPGANANARAGGPAGPGAVNTVLAAGPVETPAAPAEKIVQRKAKRVVTPTTPSNMLAFVAEGTDENGTSTSQLARGAESGVSTNGTGSERPATATRAGMGSAVQAQPTTAALATGAAAAPAVQGRVARNGEVPPGASRPARPALRDLPNRSGQGRLGDKRTVALYGDDEAAVPTERLNELAQQVAEAGADERSNQVTPKVVQSAIYDALTKPSGDTLYKLGVAVSKLYSTKEGRKPPAAFHLVTQDLVPSIAEEFVQAVKDLKAGKKVQPLFDDSVLPERAGSVLQAVTQPHPVEVSEQRNERERIGEAEKKTEAERAAAEELKRGTEEKLQGWRGATAKGVEPRPEVGVTGELRMKLVAAKNLVQSRVLERLMPPYKAGRQLVFRSQEMAAPVKLGSPTTRVAAPNQLRFLRAQFTADDLVSEIDALLFDTTRDGTKLVRRLSDTTTEEALDRVRTMLRESGLLDPNEPDLFSRKPEGDAPAAGMVVSDVEQQVERIQSKWGNAPPVIVAADYNGLPINLITQAQREGARGVFYNGKVYLVAHNLSSPEEVQFTLVHEAVGHYGLRSVLGDAYEATLTALADANEGLAEEAARLQEKHGLDRLLAIEEALADRAGRSVPVTGWERFMAAVVRGLRAIGLGKLADWLAAVAKVPELGQDAVGALLQQALDYVRTTHPSTTVTATGTAFSRLAADQRVPEPLFSRAAAAPVMVSGLFDQEMRTKAREALTAGKTNTTDALGRAWMSTLHLRSLADDYAGELPLAPEIADALFEKEASVTAHATEADQLVRDFERMADRELLTSLLYEETTAQLWSDVEFDKQKQVPDLVRTMRQKNDRLTAEQAREQLRAQHAQLAEMWQRLNPQARSMLKRIRSLMWQRRAAVVMAMRRFITQLEPDPSTRAERLKELDRAFTAVAGPYFPLLRFGEYGIAVYDQDNNLLEFTFTETPAQSDAMRAQLASTYPNTDVRQFKRSKIATELGGIRDTRFIDSIQTMISNRVEDEALASGLQTAVRQLFIASLPEYNARQRFLPRKNVPGFSRDAPRVLGQHVLSSLRYESALRFNPTIQAGLQDAADYTSNDPRKQKAFYLRLDLEGGRTVAEVHPTRISMYRRLGEVFDSGEYKNHDVKTLQGDEEDIAKALPEEATQLVERARSIVSTPMPQNTATAKAVEEELRKRISSTFREDTPKIVQFLGNMTYVWYLGLTPSFVLANLSQNPLVTLPMVAARYGMRRASAEMMRAAKQVGPEMFRAIREGYRTGTFDAKQMRTLTADEQELMQYLLNRNLLDLTQSIDLGTVAEGGGAAMNAWRKAMKYGTLTGHYSEIYNRLVAALTAYRLSADREVDKQARFKYAYDVISRTHGDYSAINRPGIMTRNTLLRLAFQFRNYAFMMTHHILRMARESWKGETAEVRDEARRMLMYSVGTGLLLAGARGLPFYTAFLLAAALMGIDDPEDQMLAWAAQTTGSRKVADVLVKGLPFLMGGDLSNRIGLGSSLPFSNTLQWRGSRDGEDQLTGMFWDAALGPFGGIALDAAVRAPGFWQQGDVQKALEAVSPKVIRDISQAMRFGAEGVTNKRGDVLLAAEAVDGMDMFWKAIGVQPSDVSSVQQDRGHILNLAQRALDERTRLLARYRVAMLAGDLDAANEARLEANDYNRKHPTAPIKARAFVDAVKRQSARQVLLNSTGGRAATDKEADLLRALVSEAEAN